MKTALKNLVHLLIVVIVAQTFSSCNDEWKDEQYIKYVSFVRSGYVDTYLNTNTADGMVHYKIPIEISGSTKNDKDVTVNVVIDPDTLTAFNRETYFTRTDLFYRQLDEKYYNFPNGMTVTIPAGKDIGYLNVDFNIRNLDLVEKYVLPLRIESTSEYVPSPKKYYKRSLMRIIPFNYFSGTYSAGAGQITSTTNGVTNTTPTSVATREMRYVNDSTVFFYAGLTEEDARNRSLYKIQVKFNSDMTVTLTADSARINFVADTSIDPKTGKSKCSYEIKEEMDALQPYLLIRTLTLNLQYRYDDVTNPYYTVTYNFKGSYTLERRRNTQIPEEDQQEIFEW